MTPRGKDDWPFDDPKNVATITTRQVILKGEPILLVSHSADDGCWQFLTGGPFSVEDGMVIALHEIAQRDPTICELADLPLGWTAQRDSVGAPWRRSEDEQER